MNTAGLNGRGVALVVAVSVASLSTLLNAPGPLSDRPASAQADSPTPVLFYGRSHVVRPRTVDAARITTTTGGGPFDETTYRGRQLKWSRWGRTRAVGRGRITFCVAEYVPCRTRRGTVTVSSIVRGGCGTASPAYRYVRWSLPGHTSPRIDVRARC